jgi:hypothetical protein
MLPVLLAALASLNISARTLNLSMGIPFHPLYWKNATRVGKILQGQRLNTTADFHRIKALLPEVF